MNRPRKRTPVHRPEFVSGGGVSFGTGRAKDSESVDVDERRLRGRLVVKDGDETTRSCKPVDSGSGFLSLRRIIKAAKRRALKRRALLSTDLGFARKYGFTWKRRY